MGKPDAGGTTATFTGSTVDLGSARFYDGTVYFLDATFTGSTVDFNDATFTGGTVELGAPQVWSVPPVGVDGSEQGVSWPSPEYLAEIIE